MKCEECGSSMTWDTEHCFSPTCSRYRSVEDERAEAEREAAAELATARKSTKWNGAVSYLSHRTPRRLKEQVVELHTTDPDLWWARHHFGFGMSVRNELRRGGYGEAELGITNLDNVWVALVEEAFGCSPKS